MNPISDYAIIDFFDWLCCRYERDTQTISQFISDQGNFQLLREEAKTYLNSDDRCPAKSWISRFIASREFEEAFNECDRKYCDRARCADLDFHLRCCRVDLNHAYYRFVKHSEIELRHRKESVIDSDSLVYGVREYVNRNYDKLDYGRKYFDTNSDVLQFLMTNMSGKLSIGEELEFVEWLTETKRMDPYVAGRMPLEKYINIVDEYVIDTKKSDSIKRNLINEYKSSGLKNAVRRVRAVLKMDNVHYAKPISVLMNRYFTESDDHYNCVILPLSEPGHQKQFKLLIQDYWNDLNSLSSDYLDIYYSDSRETGFDTAQKLKQLPREIQLSAPSIVIWKSRIKDARAISIRSLDAKQIFDVFCTIVKNIAIREEIDTIIAEAIKRTEELRMENKSMIVNNVSGVGNVVGNTDSVATVTLGDDNELSLRDVKNTTFSSEDLKNAKKAIDNALGIEEEIKDNLKSLLDDANTLSGKSEKEQKTIKAKLKVILEYVKNHAPVLLSKLAEFATIASFIEQLLRK